MKNKKLYFVIALLFIVALLAVYFFVFKDKNKSPYESVNWPTYTNEQMGISFQYPEKAMAFNDYTFGLCDSSKNNLVPYKVFADDEKIFIKAEYYYEEEADGGCKKVYNSIDKLSEKKEGMWRDLWRITRSEIKDTDELDRYINENFGLGSCHLGEMTESEVQPGVFDVKIKGDGLDLGSTKCPVNWMVYLKYFPETESLYHWDTGQECQIKFRWQANCLDQEIINSMRFF